MSFFIHFIAINSDYPHLLSQGLFKDCPSYVDTESWCIVYVYAIMAIDHNINFGSLLEHQEGGGSTPSLYPDLPPLLCRRKDSSCILILITSVS